LPLEGESSAWLLQTRRATIALLEGYLMNTKCSFLLWIVATSITCGLNDTHAADPLPSWNDGAAKQSILDFVAKVTGPGSSDFVPESERIAVFDNDGCLWSEQPVYFQAFFIFDRISQLAPQHPEWKAKEPYASVLKGDLKSALSGGEHALIEMAMATHAGTTTEEFEKLVADWITTARHPTTGRRYTEMVYQPMLEVLKHLRANGFKTFIVSGGGIEFMRVFSQRVYGIPPEQVIGSSIKTEFQIRDGHPVLVRLPEINFVDDKAGKPVGIQTHIGRRPIAAFGNSDGDLQMMQWTAAGDRSRFCLYVHHTDGEREWAYDRESSIGRLSKGLDEARSRGWTVVDMKRDWKAVYPPTPVAHHYFMKVPHQHTAAWSYSGATGPKNWGNLDPAYHAADGERQSPIDINTDEAVLASLPDLTFQYRTEQISAINNGHTIQHDETPGSFLVVGGKGYTLEQFHMHAPSEHTINGRHYPLEMHFVHKAEDDQVLVVAVLVGEDEAGNLSFPLYKELPATAGEKVTVDRVRNPAEFLPARRDYFAYTGSFTTPPCTEGVRWVVMRHPVGAPSRAIERFAAILNANNRPVQKLNERLVHQSR
jgi:carbonic anhydrase/phosphoserine phosphatase